MHKSYRLIHNGQYDSCVCVYVHVVVFLVLAISLSSIHSACVWVSFSVSLSVCISIKFIDKKKEEDTISWALCHMFNCWFTHSFIHQNQMASDSCSLIRTFICNINRVLATNHVHVNCFFSFKLFSCCFSRHYYFALLFVFVIVVFLFVYIDWSLPKRRFFCFK